VNEWQLVLIANGQKLSDSTLNKLKDFKAEVTLVNTDELLTPGRARNLGLGHVKHPWVYLIDDDAFILPGYWEEALPLLGDVKIDVLGGPDSMAPGMTKFSEALSITLASPFCTGLTFSRHHALGSRVMMADEEKLTSCNLWIRRSLLGPDPFPEDFLRAEETVVLLNLSRLGARMYYHPKMRVAHFRRKKIQDLIRPTFLAGYYRSKTMKKTPSAGSEVFWLPSVFVLLHLYGFFSPTLFWMLAKLYLGIVGGVSIGLGLKAHRALLAPLILFLHYFIVFFYGVGFLYERIRRIK
jgi:glycosyltransferase involved in cell wall biosynthesis